MQWVGSVKIDERVYTAQYKRPEQERGPRAAFDLQEEQATPQPEDIVQLSMGLDGVWRVAATQAADDAAMQSSESSFAAAFPRMTRLYHSLLRVYSSNGLAHALEHTRGLLVDLYA